MREWNGERAWGGRSCISRILYTTRFPAHEAGPTSRRLLRAPVSRGMAARRLGESEPAVLRHHRMDLILTESMSSEVQPKLHRSARPSACGQSEPNRICSVPMKSFS